MALWDSIKDVFDRASNRSSGSTGSSGGGTRSPISSGSAIGGAIGGVIGGPIGAKAGSLIGGAIGTTAGGGMGTETAPTTPTDPTRDYINQLAEAQRRSRIARLDEARAAALADLDTEQSRVEPMYYNKRNQAAARSDVNAMNFANYMAARGIKGAAGAMPEIYRNAALQSQIGALDQAEAQTMADIERQRGLIESNYQFDVAQANADVESQAMQTLIDQWNRNRQYELERAGLMGNLGGAPTLARQQMEADMTGYWNPWAAVVVPDEVREQLRPYMGNLQAFIDQQVPGSDMWKYAQALRYEKIMSDPTLKEKYGQQYQTVAGMREAYQNQLAQLDIARREIENSYLPEIYKTQIQQGWNEVLAGRKAPEKLQAEIDLIKKQTALMGTRSGGGSGGSGNSSGLTDNTVFNTVTREINDLYAEVQKGQMTKPQALQAIAKYQNYPEIYNPLRAEIEKIYPGNTQYLQPIGPGL